MNPENILLPPLHIKRGLMKIFVKAMNHDGAAFMYFDFSKAKPNSKECLLGRKLKNYCWMTRLQKNLILLVLIILFYYVSELDAWKSFIQVVDNFFGKI